MKKITRREFLKTGSATLVSCTFVLGLGGYHRLLDANASPVSDKTVLRFLHVSDTHLDLNNPRTVKWVEMLVEKINRDFTSVEFVLFGGDNFNNNVAAKEDALKFKQIADGLHCPWYSVRGNKESTPKPKDDPLNQNDYARLFFSGDIQVFGRHWKLKKGKYTILGIDTTIEHKNNGIYTSRALSFVEDELKNNPDSYYILLDHHPYENFWGGTTEKDIHKYVLNNADEVKKRLFKYSNLILTLSGHKHLDYVGKNDSVKTIATVGFVVPQDADTENDHRFRYLEIKDNAITEKLVSIL